MPLYEYQCDACGARFERIQKFSDPPVKECPKCNGHVHKLLSSPAIQFKGTGWYVTDYAKSGGSKDTKETKGTKETESKDTKAASEDKKGSGSSSDSKDSSSSSSSTPSTPTKS